MKDSFLYNGLPCIRYKENFIVFSPYISEIAVLREKELADISVKQNLSKRNFFGMPKSCHEIYGKNIARLTLINTYDCNLRCIYCFAESAKRKLYMNEKIARRAIDEVIKPHTRKIYLYFFGGEPTLNFRCIKSSVEYINNKDLKTEYEITTNGIMNDTTLNFLIKNNFLFFVSIDGMPEIQNKQRPFPNGNESYEVVSKNIRKILSEGCDLKVRTTITKDNVNKMSDIVEHFNSLGINCIHFEPLNPSGKVLKRFDLRPSYKEYIDNFIKALDTAKNYGIRITESTYFFLLNPSLQYCLSSHGGRLMLTPEGKIVFCLEAQNPRNPLSEMLTIGKYNISSDKFEYNNEKIKNLLSHSVNKISRCKHCFAKYMCCGGCIAHNVIKTGDYYKVDNYYCKIRTSLLKDAIIRMYINSNNCISLEEFNKKDKDRLAKLIKTIYKKIGNSKEITGDKYLEYLNTNNLKTIIIKYNREIIGYGEYKIEKNMLMFRGIVAEKKFKRSELFENTFNLLIDYFQKLKITKVSVPETCTTATKEFFLEKDILELKKHLKIIFDTVG